MFKTIMILASLIVGAFLLLSGCRTTPYTGLPCPIDERAVPGLKHQAETGDAEAQFQMGVWYLSECGGADESKSAYWYERAAEQDHSEAQYRLANMYFYGLGAPKNIELCVKWYRIAATQGHVFSARTLGDIFGPVVKGTIDNKFIKGPIPLKWLLEVFSIPGAKPLHTALYILYEKGLQKDPREIKISNVGAKRFGLSRDVKYKCLRKLEAAGLIERKAKQGHSTRIILKDKN